MVLAVLSGSLEPDWLQCAYTPIGLRQREQSVMNMKTFINCVTALSAVVRLFQDQQVEAKALTCSLGRRLEKVLRARGENAKNPKRTKSLLPDRRGQEKSLAVSLLESGQEALRLRSKRCYGTLVQ
jgi:hypothetical protein